jgi:autotransporter-associated beta strand protein
MKNQSKTQSTVTGLKIKYAFVAPKAFGAGLGDTGLRFEATARQIAAVRFRPFALTALAVLCALSWLATPANATDRYWTGGVNGYWGEPGNWDPAGIPQNGDNLYFDGRHDWNLSMFNDLVGFAPTSVVFLGNTYDYQLSGNSLTFGASGGVEDFLDGSHTITINCPLVFNDGGDITVEPGNGTLSDNTAELHLDNDITVNSGQLTLSAIADSGLLGGALATIYVSGQVSGNGDLAASAQSSDAQNQGAWVEFNGTGNNTITGTFYVRTAGNSGIVFNQSSGYAADTLLVVDGGDTANLAFSQPNQLGPDASILIEAGSYLHLSGHGAAVNSIIMRNLSDDSRASVLDTGLVNLGLASGGIAVRCDNDEHMPIIYGQLTLSDSAPVDVHGTAAYGLEIAAQIGGPGGLLKTGASTLVLSGSNSFAGSVTAVEGTLEARTDTALGNPASAGSSGVILYGGILALRAVNVGARPLAVYPVPQGSAVIAAYQQCSWAGPVYLFTNLNVEPFDATGGNLIINGGVGLNVDLRHAGSTLNIGNGAAVSLNGEIVGSGPFTKSGPGPLSLGGAAKNFYDGDTIVSEGTLYLSKNQNVIAVPGDLVIGPAPAGSSASATFLNSGEMGGATATVNARSSLVLSGSTVALSQLNLNDGGSVTGAGTLAFYSGGGRINVGSQGAGGSHVHSSIAGQIQLPGNDFPLTFNVNPYAIFFPFDTTPELDVTAAICIVGGEDPLLFPTGIAKEGLGQLRLSGNNCFKGIAAINHGTLIASSPTALGTTDGPTVVNNDAVLALDTATSGLTITGEQVVLNSVNVPALDSRNGSNTWNGPIVLSQTAGISVDGYLQVLNTISGSGGLTKLGPGTLQFWGYNSNSYSGTTTISQGALELNGVNLPLLPGDVVVGDDTTSTTIATLRAERDQEFNPTANLTVHRSGLLELYPFPGVPVPTPIIGTLAGEGKISLGAGTSLTVNNSGACTFAGSIGGSGAFNKSGPGTLQLTGTHTYSGPTAISGGTLQVDGYQPRSAVSLTSNSRLQGSGTVGRILVSGTGASVVAAGPGMLTCSNISMSGGVLVGPAMQFKLNGLTPGVEYDQLDVHGTVTLGTRVALQVQLNFTTWLSNSFTIIKHDGTDPVVGTFYGLAEGATMTIDRRQFRISYKGGDGNDVVLTQISGTPPPPTLTMASAAPDAITLSWPTSGPAFTLQVCTDLASSNWAPVASAPIIVGANYVVTNATAGPQGFYRLVH